MRSGSHGNGAGAGCDVDAESDSVRRHHDVAVQHGGVDAIAAHRLQRDLGGQIGLLEGIQDRPLATHCPVLREAAAGLAHEPHGRVNAAVAAGGGQERPHGGCRHGGGRYLWARGGEGSASDEPPAE